MGKNSWFNAVKKAFRSPSNDDEKRSSRRREQNDPEEEEEQKKRGKKRWIFSRHLSLETTIQHNVAKCTNSSAVRICSGEENLVRKQPKIDQTEQRRAFEVAMATTAAAEAAVATAQAAVEIIRRSRPALLVKQDKAALVIQKHFKGYLARRALMALRGVVKLQAIIRGHNVRKRAKTTLKCIESLVRVQSIVCDQRRRLSCEAATFGSIFTHHKTSSRVSNSLDVNPSELEEIHTLIQKAKECSLKQGKTLAHALSQQIWGKEDDQSSDKSSTAYSCNRKDRNLCINPIKTVEVDETSFSLYNHHEPYMLMETPFKGKHLTLSLQSPKTPSYSKTRSIPCSPCYQHEGRKSEAAETPTWRRRMSMSHENSCPLPRPNYMAATASAMARVRPNSTPRQRRTSPSREAIGSARKRLSFPVHDDHDHDHFEDKSNFQRCRGTQFGDELRLDKPYYGTD